MTENKWDVFTKTGKIGDYLTYKSEAFSNAIGEQKSVDNDRRGCSSGEVNGGERQVF